jgi:hypothetical protein
MPKYVFQNETLVWEISKTVEFSLKASMVSVETGVLYITTGR